VHIPPLRERREDIPALSRAFLEAAARELKVEAKVLRSETLAYLRTLDWPGNVRQLENTCRWLTVMASGKEVHLDDLPPELRVPAAPSERGSDGWEAELRRWAEGRLAGGETGILDDALPRFERVLLDAALRRTGGRRQEAARLLGWGRNTLTRKLKDLGIPDL
jgi:two-component system nitrogen regulation response regulator GlnG